jgi:hypothetical protein
MRNSFHGIFILSIVLTITITPSGLVWAQDGSEPGLPGEDDIYEGLPICAPDVYLVTPEDCLPVGPSQNLTDWAEKGLAIPLKPLQASKPSPAYTELNQKYAKLNLLPGVQAAYYPNIESAVQGFGALSRLPAGETLYVAYENVAYHDGNPYVANARGEWIRASPTAYSEFQGLLFDRPVESTFGWILDQIQPLREPSIFAPVVNKTLPAQSVVQIYDEVQAEGTTWYMIGFGEWVDRRYIRAVYPRLTQPDGVDNGRWIEVNLYEQTLTVYEDNHLIFATLVGTGYDPYYTQPGLFQIYEKKELETMEGSFETGKADYYYLENVPWTMYYDGPRALHGAYWRQRYGYEISHGCVNISVGDSRWLFEWAEVGDWVYVWDPSGNTPTDPAFYQGSAAF